MLFLCKLCGEIMYLSGCGCCPREYVINYLARINRIFRMLGKVP